MTINISLSPETAAELHRRAAAAGKDVAEFARQAVEEKLAIPESFAEILGPIHAATEASGGVDPAELDSLVDQCRDEVFVDKRARRAT